MSRIMSIMHTENAIDILTTDGEKLRIERVEFGVKSRFEWLKDYRIYDFDIDDTIRILDAIEEGDAEFYAKMTYGDFSEAAALFDCNHIETTPQENGYPTQLKSALIGFDTYEQAEKIARLLDLDMRYFDKQVGWDVWHRTNNTAYECFELTPEDYGDGYQFYGWNDIDIIQNDAVECANNCDCYRDLVGIVNDAKELIDEVEKIDDDQVVVAFGMQYQETINPKCMQYEFDGHSHAIGLCNYEY